MNKAQIFSVDFIIGLVIFMPFLLLLSFLWNYSNSQFQETETIIDMREKVVFISDLLIKTGGNPANWTSANVVSVGLATSNNRISQEKLNELNEISCLEFKNIFDMLYNFYLEVKDINENVLFADEKCGNYSKAEKIIPVKRYVLLDGKLVILKVILWQ